MPSDVDGFLRTTERSSKRELQKKYFERSAKWIEQGPTDIVDLPSVYLVDSWDRITKAGITPERYMAFESSRMILEKIRDQKNRLRREGHIVTLHHNEILSALVDKPPAYLQCGNYYPVPSVGLFHFDFCDALTPKYRVFMLAEAVHKHMAQKAAVIVTFSTRSPGNNDRLNYAMGQYLQQLGVKLTHAESHAYRDTASMRTNLYLVQRT